MQPLYPKQYQTILAKCSNAHATYHVALPCPSKTKHYIRIRSSPNNQATLLHEPQPQVPICDFTYCNDKYLTETAAKKLTKHATLQLLQTQLGWPVFPPIVITMGIKWIIHTTTIKNLQNLHISTNNIRKLIETLSQIAIIYPTHIFPNK